MAGQRIDIMELRTLIALKLKKFSNQKVALLLKINRKTVDGYIKRFTDLNYDKQTATYLEKRKISFDMKTNYYFINQVSIII